MAYISSEEVKKVREAIKKEFPEYKWSITKEHYTSIIIALMEADFEVKDDEKYINEHHLDDHKNESIKRIFLKVKEILFATVKYHNNSDAMTDYFDVAYYYDFQIGKWNKPYRRVKMKKDKPSTLSICCNAPVRIEGKTTHYFVCEKCGKACDTHFNIKGYEQVRVHQGNHYPEDKIK